jgi:hypothetical protein
MAPTKFTEIVGAFAPDTVVAEHWRFLVPAAWGIDASTVRFPPGALGSVPFQTIGTLDELDTTPPPLANEQVTDPT